MDRIKGAILRKIRKGSVKWVLCDYFDTVVRRKCSPEAVKRKWAKRMSEGLNYKFSPFQIYQIRKSAEKAISQKYEGFSNKSYSYEELAIEIYHRLFVLFQENGETWKDNQEEFCQNSFRYETQIEKEVQVLDEQVFEILQEAHKYGCKIAIVSDFYMGENSYKIFAEKELLDIIDEMFISCDYGKRKDQGELYDLIISRLQTASADCIMLGDNKQSDYTIPLGKGIPSFWIKREHKKWNERRATERRLWQLYRQYRREGYAGYAFSLYFFIERLYEHLCKEHVETVFFLAREGEYLKELFDEYCNLKNKNNHSSGWIKSKYLYVSRLSTFVPTLRELEKEDFACLFRQDCNLSVYSFLKSIGFKKEWISQVCEEIGIPEKKIVDDFPHSKEFSQLKNNEYFKTNYNNLRIVQKKNFYEYIVQEAGEGELAIVDVGWKGTIQDNIYLFMQGERTVSGYYLGLTDNRLVRTKNRKKGLLFSCYPSQSKNCEIWGYDKSFYEKILYASHPSTVGYVRQGEKIIPEFEFFSEEENTYRFIRSHQIMWKRIFSEIALVLDGSGYCSEELEGTFTQIYLHNICHIGKKELRMQKFLTDHHFQNFGEFSWTQNNLADLIWKMFKMNAGAVTNELIRNGISLHYMYPAWKVLRKKKLDVFLCFYTRLVYLREKRKIEKNEGIVNWNGR